MRPLSALDAQYLLIETPTTYGHVGSVLVLDPSTAPQGRWDLEVVRALMAERMHRAPVLRRRLVEAPLGLVRPSWEDEAEVDLDHHVRGVALPAPGSDQDLEEQIATLHARPLDRGRPLWEVYVITGLSGGRTALYSKIHHAAVDGVAGSQLMAAFLDRHPDPAPLPVSGSSAVVPTSTHGAVPHQRIGWTETARSLAGGALSTARTLPRVLPHLGRLPGAGNLGLSSLKAPRTPLNVPVGPDRRVAFVSLPLGDVKQVRAAFGGTDNDVVLALCTAALRTWLGEHDALPEKPLVAAVPISVRTRVGAGAEEGNQISLLMVPLPTHVGDPRERLRSVRVAMEEAKDRFTATPPRLLHEAASLVPAIGSGVAARALFHLAALPGPPFNLFVSNVPGPRIPLYLGGAEVTAMYPVSAVTDVTGALNITLFSYRGALYFGLVACRDALPDVAALARLLEDGLAELVDLAG